MQRIADALSATNLPFAAYGWDTAPCGDYGVYGLDSGYSFDADNRTAETAVQGTVDYFTRTDGEAVRRTIEAALHDIPHRLNSVQFEDDTKFLHLEWVVTLYA